MKSFVLTETRTFIRSKGITQTFTGELEAAYLYSERDKKYVRCYDKLRGSLVFHDGDLLVFRLLSGLLKLYRYIEGAFEALPFKVENFIFCPYGFVYQRYRDRWYFGQEEILLGKTIIISNVFATAQSDGTLLVRYFDKGKVVETIWKGYEFAYFLCHRGTFVVGARMDGGFDVLTPAGRLYKPRRHCFLKSRAQPYANISLFGWDEKSSSFLRLYKGMDCSFWMNTVFSPKDFPPTLWGFDNQNKMVTLASAFVFRLEDSLIRVGDKEFVKRSSYMLDF